MTQRPLFDPSKMAAAREAKAAPAPPASDAPLTVSQLAARIDGALKSGLPGEVRVVGEVSGFRERTHWYFDLKDADAIVNCVVFASSARKAGFTPTIGQSVVAKGRIDFYAKGGKVTLIIERLEPVGAGALDLEFRRLCEELRGLGWFAPERKRPLPTFPRRIAVITSRSGAALQDLLVTMRKRCPAVGVLVVDALMQGDKAAADVVQKLQFLGANARALGFDAVLITRGGGSMEDLWAFNDRGLAEAILNCPIPVAAAIGHETDTTIAELVADERCATPTQAAMRLTPDAASLVRQVDATARRLGMSLTRQIETGAQRCSAAGRAMPRAMRNGVAGARQRLSRGVALLQRARPSAVHARLVERVGALAERLRLGVTARIREDDLAGVEAGLSKAMERTIERGRERLESRQRQLAAVGPQRVLERGFSVTLNDEGQAVRSPLQVRPGEKVRTLVADGSFESSVLGESTIRVPVKREPRKRKSTDDGPGLFGTG